MTHFLEGFLNPRSIAFYGANNKGAGIGAFQFMGLINSGFKGKLYPIHLKLGSVMGYKAYKSISEVPEVPDLVVIVLPPKIVPKIFKECGQKGIKRLIVISGGFREMTGVKENNLTEELIEIALKYGMRFIGPNCLGVYNNWIYPEDENKALNTSIWEKLKRGKFSIASQSGTLSSHII
ncbi:MAG: CoA-binding protein [Candidatus Lokiarchaeota archaeon]